MKDRENKRERKTEKHKFTFKNSAGPTRMEKVNKV